MRFTLFILFAVSLLPLLSFAGTAIDSNSKEKIKQKTVSRLYQATYGSAERCKSATPEAAEKFSAVLKRFTTEKSNLMQLVTSSPFYQKAQAGFVNEQTIDPARDTAESLAGECNYLAELLMTLIDTAAGRKSLEEYERTLSE